MNTKLIGAVLLIVGTSIGAGMLALPIATAKLGLIGALFLLFGCWAIMTAGAFFILEINLSLPPNNNMISMAKSTLGPTGQVIAWLSFCLLHYTLLSAYISAGSDLTAYLLDYFNIHLSHIIATLSFTLIFGLIVCLGIQCIDYVNRGFMFFKLVAFVILIVLMLPFVSGLNFVDGDYSAFTSSEAWLVTITSFGYAAIIPSLRVFFMDNPLDLKKAILIGSMIPLTCYVFWDIAIMGVIPLIGDHGLMHVASAERSTSTLLEAITFHTHSHLIWTLLKIFTSICVITSFLGVSLCLVDFSSDALSIRSIGKNRIFLSLITFAPPVLLVLFSPHIFIKALAYAGIDCVILLVFLPAVMVIASRCRQKETASFRVPVGIWLPTVLLIVSICLIGNAVWTLR